MIRPVGRGMRMVRAAVAVAAVLALGGCMRGVTPSFDGIYPGRVAVTDGGNQCGLSGRNVLRVVRGIASIETRSTEIRGPVALDGGLGAMRVQSNLPITTLRAEGRIDGRRYTLLVEMLNNGSRGAMRCVYRYVGERDDGKDVEVDKFQPTDDAPDDAVVE